MGFTSTKPYEGANEARRRGVREDARPRPPECARRAVVAVWCLYAQFLRHRVMRLIGITLTTRTHTA